MKSPITGNEMILTIVNEEINYKGIKNLPYQHHCYLCEDSGERFTDTKLDTLNIHNIEVEYKKINNG